MGHYALVIGNWILGRYHFGYWLMWLFEYRD